MSISFICPNCSRRVFDMPESAAETPTTCPHCASQILPGERLPMDTFKYDDPPPATPRTPETKKPYTTWEFITSQILTGEKPYTTWEFIVPRLVMFLWVTVCFSALLVGLHSGYRVGEVELGGKDPFNSNKEKDSYFVERGQFSYFIHDGRVRSVSTTDMAYRAESPRGIKGVVGRIALRYNVSERGQSWDWDCHKRWGVLLQLGFFVMVLLDAIIYRSRTKCRWQKIVNRQLVVYWLASYTYATFNDWFWFSAILIISGCIDLFLFVWRRVKQWHTPCCSQPPCPLP